MFWKKKDPIQKLREETAKILAVQKLKLPPVLEKSHQDWSAFRPDKHVAVKVWMPELLHQRLERIADHNCTSRASVMRETLFTYVYGYYTYLQMKEDQDGLFYIDPNGPMFSRTANRTPHLGKNTVNTKTWLPEALKSDLQELANKTNMKLSHFVREILISHFMGHLELPARQELLRQSSEVGDDWPPENDLEE